MEFMNSNLEINELKLNVSDIINTILLIFLSFDIYYRVRNNNTKIEENTNTYKIFFDDLKKYISNYKTNILKISALMIFHTFLNSIIKVYEIQFISDLYLEKISYFSLFHMVSLFLFELWFENLSIHMNSLIKYPLIEDCKYNFLQKIKKSKLENLDNKSDHELLFALNQKIKAIKSFPSSLISFCKSFTVIIVNMITISSISHIWSFQIIANTYLYYKYLCSSKMKSNQELEKDRISKNKDCVKYTNFILQDIKNYHHLGNIDSNFIGHENVIQKYTKESNGIDHKISFGWDKYNKIVRTLSHFNWFLIVFQIVSNINEIPKEKIGEVLASCGYLSYNFNWMTGSISTFINDVSSYNVYIEMINDLCKENKCLKNIIIEYNKSSIKINNHFFEIGLNQLTGRTGTGKTTFLKNLFFSNKQDWDKISFLYQNSRHEFDEKSPKDSIVNFICYDEGIFNSVYRCIELCKNSEEILIKPSGGEIQKMRIGMILYQSMLNNSKIIILDEPDNNIDIETFNKIMFNIKELFISSIIIFTSHKGELLNVSSKKVDISYLS